MLDPTAENALARGHLAAAIQVHVLGGFRVLVRGQGLGDELWRRKKSRQLFKLLVSRPNRRARKEEVIDLLWSESDSETGSTNLRSAIHAMRRALDGVGTEAGIVAVFADRDSVWLATDADLWVDADEFEQLLEHARHASDPMPLLQRADALYAGDYLPEDLYDHWAAERREDLKRAWTGLQFQLAQEWEKCGEADPAARSLQRLLQADPCDERAARELMRLLTRHGRRSDAVRVYQRLVRALHDDLDVEPSEITTVLFDTEVPHLHGPAASDTGSRPPTEDSPPVDHDILTNRNGAASARLHNLPAQPGELIGRGEEIAAARAQMLRADVRLLTFLGPGGCGKTRLAVHVAGELLAHFEAGIWFVDLSAVRDPERIGFAIGRTLGVAQPTDGQSHLQRLVATIGEDHLLLILDNFEQVVSGGLQVAELVAGCPNLMVLVTSREPLHLRWEHQFHVPPLGGPSPAGPGSLEMIAGAPAVALFVQRAQAIKPDWRLTDANAAAVAKLCVRLDCLPLAIELAAARIKLFTPETMLARMDQQLELLTAGSRDLPERHRGLRLAIDWSHHLLSEEERAAFRRLAVFAGGWTLDAALEVCAEFAAVGTPVHQLVEALVNKSLVRVESQTDGQPRFAMLETIRDFAFAELARSGELATQQRLHAEWCVRLAEAAEPELTMHRQIARLEQLEYEHDNLRAALRWSLDGGDPPLGIRLAGALGRFWEIRGYLQEAHQWLERAVRISDGRRAPAARAKLCSVAGHVAFLRSDYERARALLEEGLTVSRDVADGPGVIQALINLALLAMTLADNAHASVLLHESRQLATDLSDRASEASSLSLLGQISFYGGQLAEARTLLEQSLELRRAVGDGWGQAQTLCDLGLVLHAQGLAAAARAAHVDGVRIWRELSDVWGLAYALEGFALLLGASSPQQAVRLLAVATVAREQVSIRPLPARATKLQDTLHACAEALGDEAYATAWSAGRAVRLEAAVEDLIGRDDGR